MAELWRTAADRATDQTVNQLYVHVPFCKSICSFCNYDRLKPSSPDNMRDWRDRVLASMRLLGPAVRGLTFQALYFGGGTPSVLTSGILREVFEGLDHHFRWHEHAYRSIELDPATVTAPKVEAMLDHDFRTFSFGMQTRNTHVNVAHNRGPQGDQTVERCLDLLPGPRFSRVAVDLLMGLSGVSPEDTLADVELLMTHPRRPAIDLFHLSPTKSYITSHFAGSRSAASETLARYDDDFHARLAALADKYTYALRDHDSHHAHALEPQRLRRRTSRTRMRTYLRQTRADLTRMAKRARAGRPLPRRRVPGLLASYTQLANNAGRPHNLLGLGPSARSQIFGVASTQTHPPGGEAGPTTYRGSLIDMTDELRTFVIFDIRDRARVMDDRLRSIFGTTLVDAFPDVVSVWQQAGFARAVPGGWEFPRLRPDDLARHMLWLLPEAVLERAMRGKTHRPGASRPRSTHR